MGYVDVGDGYWRRNVLVTIFKMLVTFLAISVTSTTPLLTLASSTDIQKMSPRSYFCRQHSKIVTNGKSPTSQCHQHDCSLFEFLFLLANPGKLIQIFFLGPFSGNPIPFFGIRMTFPEIDMGLTPATCE